MWRRGRVTGGPPAAPRSAPTSDWFKKRDGLPGPRVIAICRLFYRLRKRPRLDGAGLAEDANAPEKSEKTARKASRASMVV